jgi:chlorobactene glucosyltransferase
MREVTYLWPAIIGVLILVNLAFAFRSQYIAFNSRFALEAVPPPKVAPQRISIVVPARNEARQIESCVRSLLAQAYPNLDVIVVDDRSEDATASIVTRIAAEDSRVRLIAGDALPPDWVGKPWALDQGARHATGDWLLFTDADTIHQPGALSAAIGYARAHNLDVLSVLTDQIMLTPAEWIFLPSVLWTIAFAIGSLKAINDPARENALFNGQYILASRRAYDGIGGHEAVRNEIAEDLELARLFKADGRFRSALVNGSGLVRVRMYRSFRELWQGFVKNFWVGARGQGFFAAIGILLLACVAPITPIALVIALVVHAQTAAAALALAMLCAIVGASPGMRRLGLGSRSSWCLPIGITLVVAIFLTSIIAHARGGVIWRGRRYAA